MTVVQSNKAVSREPVDYPKTIYVRWAGDQDLTYLDTEADIEEVNATDGEVVAVYELKGYVALETKVETIVTVSPVDFERQA